jgi:hypothetical protein
MEDYGFAMEKEEEELGGGGGGEKKNDDKRTRDIKGGVEKLLARIPISITL